MANFIDKVKESEFWTSTESRAAIFVTGILVIIAGFLVYNYYEKTEITENENNEKIENLAESENETEGETLGTEEKNSDAYVVKEGDTLWSIAENELGDPYRWKKIKDLNNLSTTEVENGQVLILPQDEEEIVAENSEITIEEETQETEEVNPEEGDILASTAVNETTYVVERGETLWSIAEEVYGDAYLYTKILEANPNLGRLPNGSVLIHCGNLLVIPQL